MCPNDAEGMANRVDPDQTVSSGSTQIAQDDLSENLGHYGKIPLVVITGQQTIDLYIPRVPFLGLLC